MVVLYAFIVQKAARKDCSQGAPFMRGRVHTDELIHIGLFSVSHITVSFFFSYPGLIVDMAGDYRAGFYMAGATLILAAVFLVVLDQFQQRSEKGNHTSTKSEKLSLPYTSFHFLKLQKRRYQDHDVAV